LQALSPQGGAFNDSALFVNPGMGVNADMAKRAGEGSAAGAATGKLLGILEK
jgi:hypothetical protein